MLRVAQVQSIHELRRCKGMSQRRIAELLRIDVKTVRRVLAGEWDGEYTLSEPRKRPKADTIEGTVLELLENERKLGTPRKQRLRASGVHKILVGNGHEVSRRTVERVVRRVRFDQRDVLEAAMVPLEYEPGIDAQADFIEGKVATPGGLQTVRYLLLRACFSTRVFIQRVPATNQEALLEALEAGFAFFGGVFIHIWFDNLRPAVQEVLRGRNRRLQEQFEGFQAHYGFRAEFCRVREPHEKGGVEREAREVLAGVLTPMPTVSQMTELEPLETAWLKERDERPARGSTTSALWALEVEHLIPLPKQPFGGGKKVHRHVSAYSLVQYGTNSYSVPVRYVGRSLWVKVLATRIEILDVDVVAEHERLYGRNQVAFKLEHYLDLLERKPRAFDRAAPVRLHRRGWPPEYERLLSILREREGDADGTRSFIGVLRLCVAHPAAAVHASVVQALQHSAPSLGLVTAILTAAEREAAPTSPLAADTVIRWPAVSVSSAMPEDYAVLLRRAQ